LAREGEFLLGYVRSPDKGVLLVYSIQNILFFVMLDNNGSCSVLDAPEPDLKGKKLEVICGFLPGYRESGRDKCVGDFKKCLAMIFSLFPQFFSQMYIY
jgi:hypothetical protein